jgi:hypothetical protein
MAGGTCHGGRPSFPPPPVLGRSTLGAVDMPIGCALTFCCLLTRALSALKGAIDAANCVLTRCDLVADAVFERKLQLQDRLPKAAYTVGWRSLGLRSR